MTATELFSEERSAEVVAASFAEHAGPAAAAGADLAGAAPARLRQGRRADRGGMGAGDRLPHPHRADVRRRAAGVHPALRRPGRLDAGGDDQPPHRRHVDRVHRARARSTWSSPRRGSWARTSRWTARASPAWSPAGSPVPTATPLAGATVDVWQANDDGFYDVQQPGVQPERNLRGLFTADADGRFWFRSVVPRYYPIPDDGPVGELLAATGRHPNRPAHVHFIVAGAGLPAADHPPVRRRHPLPRLRCGLRGQGQPGPGVPGGRRPGPGGRSRAAQPVPHRALRRRPAPGGGLDERAAVVHLPGAADAGRASAPGRPAAAR